MRMQSKIYYIDEANIRLVEDLVQIIYHLISFTMELGEKTTFISSNFYTSTFVKEKVREETDLVEFLQHSRLALSNISSTFPLCQDQNNKDSLYHRFYISELIEEDKKDSIKIYDSDYRVFACRIWDNSLEEQVDRSQSTSKVFIKAIPCYDTSTYLDFHCEKISSENENNSVSSEVQSEDVIVIPAGEEKTILESKIENKSNSCYTESMACLLTSRLTEEFISPHFPRVFGIFSATIGAHAVNFTDEFSTYNGSEEFDEGINQGIWSVLIDEDGESESYDSFDEFSLDEEDEEEEEDGNSCDLSIIRNKCSEKEGSILSSICSENESTCSEYEEEEDEKDEEAEDEKDEEEDEKSDNDHISDMNSYCSKLSFKSIKLEDLQFDEDTSFVKDVIVDERSINEMVLKELDDLEINSEILELPRKRNSFNSTSESNESRTEKYIIFKDLPCQVVAMEGFPVILEDVLDTDYRKLLSTYVKMKKCYRKVDDKNVHYCFYHWLLKTRRNMFDRKWISIMLQIVMALITMNHYYDMIHNDLHTQNILFEPTTQLYLDYKLNSVTYKVPTFGYIVKIIDFGRATYRLYDDELIMGDVFKAKGEAGEQFAYPTENYIRNPKAVPNRSFDLCRLGCSILEEVFHYHRPTFITELKFYKLIKSWTYDDKGKNILRFIGFDLYKQIVRRVHHLEPLEQLHKQCFQEYLSTELSQNCFSIL